ncbi:hypothetical protein [Burkholderia oklahomensis]|uniref:hypothetical protein n=1 Tax=Burkholderia oklahomensis TaxID=342113 RepID=UPI00016AA244|nr:hypothetical protein [Burkholderia oklahomensis]AJX35068.1 hypothetical protein BG90_5123 [Burkholderia oklahomensis C6786]AOI48801.1 hypothetical protein WI23_23550 [Burkholderia oklahomensis C6786]KUY50596.1 hypothetical protein WI23_27695 [Burkholderia oklahomensis C6786]MBI0363004.1 hypothetical protein [Burkholderia oklahomensis]SUY27104.1 Uncharacterised protein [Burkholderia oklahomensis]
MGRGDRRQAAITAYACAIGRFGAMQRVEIDRTAGTIRLANVDTRQRQRRFALREVESIRRLRGYRQNGLSMTLAPAADRRWNFVEFRNTKITDAEDSALFVALIDAVRSARPDVNIEGF